MSSSLAHTSHILSARWRLVAKSDHIGRCRRKCLHRCRNFSRAGHRTGNLDSGTGFQIPPFIPCVLPGLSHTATTLGWTPCAMSHRRHRRWTESPSMRNFCSWPRMVPSCRTSPWTGTVSSWMVRLPGYWDGSGGSNFHTWVHSWESGDLGMSQHWTLSGWQGVALSPWLCPLLKERKGHPVGHRRHLPPPRQSCAPA